MGYSRIEYPYTGGAQDFAVNFALGTLDIEDVSVYVVGEVDGFGGQVHRTFTWVSEGTIRVTEPLPNPAQVVVQRTVSKDQLEIDLQQSGAVTRVTLVRAFKQLMMNVHELLDGRADAFTGALLDGVLALRDQSVAARDASENARDSSEGARDASVIARTGSEAAQTAAASSEVAAAAARDSASGHRLNAQNAATAAATSETNAATSATSAATSATNSASTATASANSATAAGAARDAAVSAQGGAEAARDIAITAYQGRQYETRAALLADTSYAPTNGTVVSAAGRLYERVVTATGIPDLPGWVPFGNVSIAHFVENVEPGVTDLTAGATAMIAYMNANRVNGYLGRGSHRISAGVLELITPGIGLFGKGKGNVANTNPAVEAPTTVVLTGTGVGIWLRDDDQSVQGFRLTSDPTRAALAFDITQPGVRVEAFDTSAFARADRARVTLRIDNQPGDGVLLVGPVTYSRMIETDVYSCKGFGFRADNGSLAGITRTYPHYPGLLRFKDTRTGFNGGHSIALSNPTVTTQFGMAVRCRIDNHDSFGNGQNPAIMYPSADGLLYDFWIFGENCDVWNSAPCGKVGQPLVDEIMGGVWIAGRDHKLLNNRFIQCAQPIYWGHVAAQPSTGLTVNTVRVVNGTLTHAHLVRMQSADSVGLRVTYDRTDHLLAPYPSRIGTATVDAVAHYRGRTLHQKSTHSTNAAAFTMPDDTVHQIVIPGAHAGVIYSGVLTLAPSSPSVGGGMFLVRVGSGSPAVEKWAGNALAVVGPNGGNGALTGTTGTDGGINISCDATSIYIENRRGFNATFNYSLTAFQADSLGVAL